MVGLIQSKLIQILHLNDFVEASYFDRINITENGLEYDQKKLTPTNVNAGTGLKDYTNEP